MMYCKSSVVVMLIAFTCWINATSSQAFGTLGFDIHHRYSHTVKDFLDLDGLPEKGSVHYYSAMAHRDQLLKARRLATTPLLTFYGGNNTYRLSYLGFLYYSLVDVGTPAVTFLVALDTGSDLFWLPCDCTSCPRTWNSTSGKTLELSIYSPSASTSSVPVPCNSSMCGATRGCSARLNACIYQQVFHSTNTSTTGILVHDVLHLGTEHNPQNIVDVPITLGCGMTQTGDFLDRSAVNGLFGLGMDSVSVPSILASKGLVPNSFSMCFGISDRIGRIEFGDKGSPDQRVTPFNLQRSHPSYNITVTQIAVENNVTDVELTAIFDSGTAFTYLNDPAYSFIVQNFNSQIKNTRYRPRSNTIFDYCYALGPTKASYIVPNLNFTMKGGSQFFVNAPTIVINGQDGYGYCLAIVKSDDINLIGQNFMNGYRIVFDREEMVLGWKESDCSFNTPPSILNPGNRSRTPISSRPPPPPPPPPPLSSGNDAPRLSYMTTTGVMMVVLAIFSHHFIFINSS